MRLKSYFVNTMEEALQAAKVELGEDAMLVDSKPMESPAGGRSRLEVIFAAAVLPPPPPPKVAVASPAVRAESIAGLRRFRGELTMLLDSLSRQPNANRLGTVSPAWPHLDALRAAMLLAEVPPSTVDALVSNFGAFVEGLILTGEPMDNTQVETAILPLLTAELPHVRDAEVSPSKPIAFVGPTGAGKTSAIAKLAFQLGVAARRPVYVFSIDNLRIGASDQLAHLCSLLGVPFRSVDYAGALYGAIAPILGKGVVLVDTPGYGIADGDVMTETAGQLRRLEGLVCQLVVPATLRYPEMQRRLMSFAPFCPDRVLFTRLDETVYFGPAWTFARESRLSMDWVSTGPCVPEDIETADLFRLSSAVLSKSTYLSASTAQAASNFASAASAGAARI